MITADSYRYRLLETLREYTLARLAERGEVDHWNDRLLEWALTPRRVRGGVVAPAGARRRAAVRQLRRRQFRAAMDWGESRGDLVAALRIAAAVPIGLIGERRQIITSLLERLGSGVDPWFAGHAYSALGELVYDQGDWRFSYEAHTIARRHFVAAGSDHHAAWADLNGAYAAWGMGDLAEVDRVISTAIALFRTGDDAMGLGYALSVASLRTADLDEAQRLAAEADEYLRATGSPISIAHNTEARGIIAYDRAELADAATLLAEALEVFARFGNLGCSAHALEAAAVVVARGRPRRGRHRTPCRRRRAPTPEWRRPQAMGDPRPPR